MTEADLAAAADAAPSLPEQGTGTPVAAESLSGGDFLSIATEESGKLAARPALHSLAGCFLTPRSNLQKAHMP